jgi:hypothetical protein
MLVLSRLLRTVPAALFIGRLWTAVTANGWLPLLLLTSRLCRDVDPGETARSARRGGLGVGGVVGDGVGGGGHWAVFS